MIRRKRLDINLFIRGNFRIFFIKQAHVKMLIPPSYLRVPGCQGRPLCWHDIMLWLVVFTQYWVVLCGVMHQTLKVTAYHSLHLLYKWFYRHYYYYSAFLSFFPSIRLTHHVRVYRYIVTTAHLFRFFTDQIRLNWGWFRNADEPSLSRSWLVLLL